jgi:hypothetical protein
MSSTPQFGRRTVASQSDAAGVRNGPSPSFNEAMITSIDGYEEHKGYVESARSAFEVGQQSLGDLWDAMKTVAGNTAWSADKKLIELAGAARRVQERVLKAFSGATDNLNKGVLGIEAELNKPIEGGTAMTAMAGEIRAYARTLPPAERTNLIGTAISEGDSRTVIALLGGPAYLGGFESKMQAVYARQWHEKNSPVVVARLNVMQKALDRLNQVGPITFTEVEAVLHQIEFDNTGPAAGVWSRIERIETKYKAAKVALDKIP